MKIVIIGEFSSFAKNLSEGLKQIGHECFVFSWGDGYKDIKQDDSSSYTIRNRRFNEGSFISHILIIIHQFLERVKLEKYVRKLAMREKFDVVLILNGNFIRAKDKIWSPTFSKKMIFSLINNPQNIYLSACGSDVPFYDYWKDKNWKNSAMVNCFAQYGRSQQIKHHKYVTSFANKVIPVMYGYAEAWRKSKYSQNCSVLDTIPLPVNCSKFKSKNNFTDKIVIFHGITRPNVKGTPYIKAALDRLQLEYPEMVECKAEGGLPLSEYLGLIDRTNIQIDQACCEYVGMNGLYAMAMGKILIGGNEPENQKELNVTDCPIINIQPDSDMIYHKLVDVIQEDKDKLERMSECSRSYVEKVHNSQVVAQKYIDTFKRIDKSLI